MTYSLPAGPQSPPFFQVLQWIGRPIKLMQSCAERYGDSFTMRWGSLGNLVFFSHPQAIQEIFTMDPQRFDAGVSNSLLAPLLGNTSMLLLDGAPHQRQRQLLMPPFHGDRMRTYGDLIDTVTKQVAAEWRVGEAFSVRQSLQDISLQVILQAVFGVTDLQRYEALRRILPSMLDLISSPLTSSVLFISALQKDLGNASGTRLAPCIYLTHHRPELYPNPDVFDPERFLTRSYSAYEFIGFGGGNRRCLGMAFALLEMKRVLATLMMQFRFKLTDTRPMHPVRRGVTLAPPPRFELIAEFR